LKAGESCLRVIGDARTGLHSEEVRWWEFEFPPTLKASFRAMEWEKGGAPRRNMLTRLQHRAEGPKKPRSGRMLLAMSAESSALSGPGGENTVEKFS